MRAEAVDETWTLQEASDRFEELLDAAMASPQKIVDGEREFVVMTAEEWEKILASPPEAASVLE